MGHIQIRIFESAIQLFWFNAFFFIRKNHI